MMGYSYENKLDVTQNYNIKIGSSRLWRAINNLNSNEQFVIANYYGLLDEELT